MDVIIFAGQSNMQGSTGSVCDEPEILNAYEYRYLTNSFKPLKNPVGEDIDDLLLMSALGNGSLVPFFVKEYIRKTNKNVVAIHVAKGDTSIRKWQPETKRFSMMVEKIKKGLKKTKEIESIEKVFFVWLQGESDAAEFTGYDSYLSMLINFKNALKKEIGFDKFALIQQGYFAMYAPWIKVDIKKKKESDKKIMKAINDAPKIDNDFYLLTKVCFKLSRKKKYLNEKEFGPHYNNDGMKIIGKKSGASLAKLRNNDI